MVPFLTWQVFCRESGALLASGVMEPLDQTFAFNVSAPSGAWLARRTDKWADFQAYEGGALGRYALNVTKAFWRSAGPDHARSRG